MTTGDIIRAIRINRKLTQEELAQKVGIRASNLRKYESNSLRPKAATIDKFADALDVNPYVLSCNWEPQAIEAFLNILSCAEQFGCSIIRTDDNKIGLVFESINELVSSWSAFRSNLQENRQVALLDCYLDFFSGLSNESQRDTSSGQGSFHMAVSQISGKNERHLSRQRSNNKNAEN